MITYQSLQCVDVADGEPDRQLVNAFAWPGFTICRPPDRPFGAGSSAEC
jgi:hypothetical protein